MSYRITLLLLLLLGGWAAPLLADPLATEKKPPPHAPSQASRAAADALATARLTRLAIRQIDANQLEKAEATLRKALELQPGHVVNLYNLACVNARLGNDAVAIAGLEIAAEAGFTDYPLLLRDPDLDALRDLPRFKELLAKKDLWQRKAAEATLGRLKAQFGEDYLYAVDYEQKLIFATGGNELQLEELKNWLRRQARLQGRDLFENRPDAFICVVMPSVKDWAKIVRAKNVGGFYQDASKTLVAREMGQTLIHEFTHALHAADLAPLGQAHPPWIGEGLGVLYEGAQFVEGEFVPFDTERNRVAALAARRRSLVPLSKLLTMTPEEFVRRGRITYPEAGSLMLYLYERQLLRKFYDEYKSTYDDDPTGQAALEKVTGLTLAEVEARFSEWLSKRR